MRRLAVCAIALISLAACKGSERSITDPRGGATADTVRIPDPTGSRTPGALNFTLRRSEQSTVPASADSALIHITNQFTMFDNLIALKIPTPGMQTVVQAEVPADSGYVVSIVAFHNSNILDAVGTTSSFESSITVYPEGGPTYEPTAVNVSMIPAPFPIMISVSDGEHVTAGTIIEWFAQISAAAPIWTRASSTWGCGLSQNGFCGVDSYMDLVPNSPGPLLVQVSYFIDWGDHTFEVDSDPIHVIVDPGQGGIVITFRKHR